MNKQNTTWVIIIFAVGTTTSALALLLAQLVPQSSYGTVAVQGPESRVTLAVSSDNIYIAWITNRTGNDQVMFRSSNDAGATFNDKIILSNTTDAKLQDIQVAAGAENVVVIWRQQINATSDEPVARISADNGHTFESVANLASNGTINVIGI
jgi:spore coat protein CotH